MPSFSTTDKVDFLLIGAGIVGLSLARELRRQFPQQSLLLLEKENQVGIHASGRNSGVLHSGIYYPEESVKFQICASGAKELFAYCQEHALPVARMGKLILAPTAEQESQFTVFQQRAARLGITAERLLPAEVGKIEPAARACAGLYLPDTAVIQSKTVLQALLGELQNDPRVTLCFNSRVQQIDLQQGLLQTAQKNYAFGMLFNAAGAHVDRIAHQCQVGLEYTMLPFRGRYFQLSEQADLPIRGLIYPVPDSRMPFLGIHFTRSLEGKIWVGPSAMPALGREHYQGSRGIEARDAGNIALHLSRLLAGNVQGLAQHAWRELHTLRRSGFAEAAAALVPGVRSHHLVPCGKVGIRPQLYNKRENRLEMDFKILRSNRSLHILNSISPAFTSSFAFARLALQDL
ncbi:L-2-hydroxyglutarate oxidase [Candidatus Magnetaquicoccus inordinatus]|uniref:L-2-hydroxyglutarate oxidase n=1 Tax=Candidatus Magnetaquicoccus inordinatus TaxID=2496818 RepID=UPI00187D2AA1|nr:L-2-hydroxyglutarate oxidase [Candidatus Magnetaquicoccus inordinatus]